MPPTEKKIARSRKRNAAVELIRRILATIPLEFSPGEAWNYSVSTDVIGYLVARFSGSRSNSSSRSAFLDRRMNDTDFFVPADKAHRFAACYSADPKGAMTFHAADRKEA